MLKEEDLKKPNGFEESKGKNQKPKKADKEEDKEDEKDNEEDLKKNTKKKFIPPTLQDVQNYVTEKKLNVNAKDFFDYFDAGKWVDSNGNTVRSWKQKLLTWNSYKKGGVVDKKANFQNYDQRKYNNLDEFYANKGG